MRIIIGGMSVKALAMREVTRIMGSVEYWDLFNRNRVWVRNHHKRGDRIPDGLYHIVVHSWVMDYYGNFLISQRQKGRTDELMWERTGGSVLEGESSIEGAKREVGEELGIDLAEIQPVLIKSERRDKYSDFFDAWLFVVDREKTICKIDNVEVRDFKWVDLPELKRMDNDGLLVSSSLYYEEVYELYSSLKKQRCKCQHTFVQKVENFFVQLPVLCFSLLSLQIGSFILQTI